MGRPRFAGSEMICYTPGFMRDAADDLNCASIWSTIIAVSCAHVARFSSQGDRRKW